MTEAFKPRHDTVLIRLVERKETTTSGIVLTGKPRNQPIAEVIDFGPGVMRPDGHRTPIDLRLGDIVHFRPAANLYEVEVNGRTLHAIREYDILGSFVAVSDPDYGDDDELVP